MKTDTQRFMPLFPKCFGFCMGTFILFFCSCIVAYEADFPMTWLIPIPIAVLHCILVVFSVFRWNTRVYLCDKSIAQTQWGRKIIIPYSEISRVKIARSHPAPPTITIFWGQRKIAFDSTKADLFLACCTNQEINTQIEMLQK